MKKYAVMSMDVEDWYHLDYFQGTNCSRHSSMLDGLERYADILKGEGIPTTFFVLSELAMELRTTLRQLIDAGHEIASHGVAHQRPLTMELAAFGEDLKRSKEDIENVTGQPVLGFRAPCFSMDRARLNMVEDCGYLYDSSRIDFAGHKLYGSLDMSGYRQVDSCHFQKGKFHEFEVGTISKFDKRLPITGGGYLRILPWMLMRFLIRMYLLQSSLFVFYIHPFELSSWSSPEHLKHVGRATRMRFSLGRSSVEQKTLKLIKLLRNEGFMFTTFKNLCLRTEVES